MGPWFIFSSFGMLEMQNEYGDSSQIIDNRKNQYMHLLRLVCFTLMVYLIIWYNILDADEGRGVVTR